MKECQLSFIVKFIIYYGENMKILMLERKRKQKKIA